MSSLANAEAFLQDHAEAWCQQLRDLVEISSYTADQAGVCRVGEALARTLPGPCERRSGKQFGDTFVFRTPAAAHSSGALLLGHLDTVFPAEQWSGFRREGQRAMGPGVLDMKGGLVVVVAVLQALAHVGKLAALPLTFVAVGDEEVGSPESTAWVREEAQGAKLALVFEAGRKGDRIVTQRKGTASLRVCAHGRSAHAGNAHAAGANAIWALARWIDVAQGLTDYASGQTVNVGKLRGGASKNTVPDYAEAEVDLRFVTQASAQSLRAALEAATHTAAVPGTHLRIHELSARFPLERSPASVALCEAYGAEQRAVGLGSGESERVGGGSDACTTGALGVPTLDGLGPWGEGFHTLDEWVDLDSIVPKARALLRFLWKLDGVV